MEKCPLCGHSDPEVERTEEFFEVHCPRCKLFFITEAGVGEARSAGTDERYLLQAYVREASDSSGGEEPLCLTEATVQDLLGKPSPVRTPVDRMNRLMMYLAYIDDVTSRMGVSYTNDYPVAFARGKAEFRHLINTLVERKLVERDKAFEGEEGVDDLLSLTVEGWERVEKLRLPPVQRSTKCFVAMWFDESLRKVYQQAVEPAIKRAGFDPIRVDMVEHNGKIDDRIITEIRESALMVADFTGHRGGVYFEAGYALGVGIPVIWTCLNTDIENAHFDTRQYNHIVWAEDDLKGLSERLYYRIKVTIPRQGPAAGF